MYIDEVTKVKIEIGKISVEGHIFQNKIEKKCF